MDKYIVAREGVAGAFTYFVMELDEDGYRIIARCPSKRDADTIVTAFSSAFSELRRSWNDGGFR